MARPMRFGVTLPQIKRSWQEARAAAEEFDRLGYDSVWVCDHLYGVPLPNLPIFEAWTELAAVAAVTERVQLGTLVTPPFFRNPAVLAKQIATVDQISNGRTIAGLGAGWFEAEFSAYGCEFPGLGERMRALEETAEILKNSKIKDRLDTVIFAAPDALGAVGGVSILKRYGLTPSAVSGKVTCSPLAVREAERACGATMLSRQALMDPERLMPAVSHLLRDRPVGREIAA